MANATRRRPTAGIHVGQQSKRARATEAITLDAVCRDMALADADIAPLHRELLDKEKV